MIDDNEKDIKEEIEKLRRGEKTLKECGSTTLWALLIVSAILGWKPEQKKEDEDGKDKDLC